MTGEKDGRQFVGIVTKEDTHVIALDQLSIKKYEENIFPEELVDCLEDADDFILKVKNLLDWARQTEEERDLLIPLEEVRLLAPIPRPRKNIFCVGKNYQDHAIEMGSAADIPTDMIVFTKAPTTVIGTNASVLHHKNTTEELDYEGELAVIIGKVGRDIKKERVEEHIFGYTILNDMTARDLQTRHQQFFIGKSLDTTCPIGPWIVHKSLIPNPEALQLETKVNGEVRQSAKTDQFIFSIAEIISELSKGMTLEPGDIIATGTPAGVGKALKPPKFLQPGDVVEVSIERIGTIRNNIKLLE